jgi:hypothetical protein
VRQQAEDGVHLFEEEAVADHRAAAAMIPVIGLAPCFAGEAGAHCDPHVGSGENAASDLTRENCLRG